MYGMPFLSNGIRRAGLTRYSLVTMRFNSFIAAAAAVAQGVAGLGINCHGDVLCGIAYISGGRLSHLADVFDKLDDNRKYDNGDDVACIELDSLNLNGKFTSTLCAYIQNSEGDVTGATLKSVFEELQQFGCAICGSVPLHYAKGDNDINHGELTINLVEELPENCKVNEPCSA
ncbi:killer toxin [Trichoderma compactum]